MFLVPILCFLSILTQINGQTVVIRRNPMTVNDQRRTSEYHYWYRNINGGRARGYHFRYGTLQQPQRTIVVIMVQAPTTTSEPEEPLPATEEPASGALKAEPGAGIPGESEDAGIAGGVTKKPREVRSRLVAGKTTTIRKTG